VAASGRDENRRHGPNAAIVEERSEAVDSPGELLVVHQFRSAHAKPALVGEVATPPVVGLRIFDALDEEKASWEDGSGRRLTLHIRALRPDGKRIVLAYLRTRAAGPRHRTDE
jgi:hypothetical protein